ASAVAVDSTSNAYVVGNAGLDDTTAGNYFPGTPGSFQPQPTTTTEPFFAKLGAGGDLVYFTYLRGAGSPTAITVRRDGAAVIAGQTESPALPVKNPYQSPAGCTGSRNCGTDGFIIIMKPDPADSDPGSDDPSDLMSATYLGGSGADEFFSVAVNGSDEIFVTGETDSSNYPVSVNGFNTQGRVGACCGAIASVFSPDASALRYSAYLGAPPEWSAGRAVLADDATGRFFVIGSSSWQHFPTTPDAYQPVYPNVLTGDPAPPPSITPADFLAYGQQTLPNALLEARNAAFLVELDPHARTPADSLYYSTYLGGKGGGTEGWGIAGGRCGGVYISGNTRSTEFPTEPDEPDGVFQRNYGGDNEPRFGDGFAAYFAPQPAVERVQPASGPAGGGTTVRLSGSGFTGVAGVSFESPGLLGPAAAVAAASFKVNSCNEISAVTPPHEPGTVDVKVATVGAKSVTGPRGPGGVSLGLPTADDFTYTPETDGGNPIGDGQDDGVSPLISSIDPNFG
ncbi:MAG: IPT/TIG domain-containing protein, partial [Actinomycetota bacterium]